MPIVPDAHGVAVLLLIAVALFLFTRDRLPLETSSLAILIILVAGFQFFPYESDGVRLGPAQFFSGFGNEALIAICALMMVGKALETTGALQPLATIVSQSWTTRPLLALLLTLVAVAALSAFINDTPIVVIMIPILVGISLRAKFPVSGVMLPTRELPMADTTPRVFNAQLLIKENGYAAGKTLSEILAKTTGQMHVDRIQRSEALFLAKLPSMILQPGDRLIVRDSRENLKLFERLLGATLYNISDSAHPIDEHTPLAIIMWIGFSIVLPLLYDI